MTIMRIKKRMELIKSSAGTWMGLRNTGHDEGEDGLSLTSRKGGREETPPLGVPPISCLDLGRPAFHLMIPAPSVPPPLFLLPPTTELGRQ